MARLSIRTWPDPVLASKCAPVGAVGEDIRRLAADMLETMYAAEGRGLAAPQVGRPLRLFVMDEAWKETAPAPRVFVDPEILWSSPEVAAMEEGCLSIPGIAARVERPVRIRLRWRDLDGTSHEEEMDGFVATCAQHETDHLDGIVTLDRVDGETRQALIAEYSA